MTLMALALAFQIIKLIGLTTLVGFAGYQAYSAIKQSIR